MTTTSTNARLAAARTWKTLATGLAFLVATLIAAVFAVRLLATKPHAFLYNADNVHTLMVARDLLADPRSLLDWYHSPALFVLPDWLLALVLLLVGTPVPYLPVAFYAASAALLAIGFGALLWASEVERLAEALMVSAVFIALVFASAAALPSFGSELLATIAVPSIHSGSVSLGLMLAAACLRLVPPDMRVGRWASAAILVFCFAGGYSDLLFAIWFVGPVAIVLALRAQPRTFRAITFPAAMVAVALLAFAVDLLFRSADGYFSAMVRQRDIVQSLETWRDLLVGAAYAGDCILLTATALTVPMLLRGLALVWRLTRLIPVSRAEAAELMLIGTHFSALSVPLAAGLLYDLNNIRYSLPFMFTGLFWATVWVAARWPLAARRTTSALAGMAALGSLLLLPSTIVATRAITKPGQLAACLLAAGDRVGLGEYWRAKNVMLETDYHVHIVQITSRAHAYRFNINNRWYERHAQDGAPLVKASFIVMQDLIEEDIRALFGGPDHVEHCGGETIWRYTDGLDTTLVK